MPMSKFLSAPPNDKVILVEIEGGQIFERLNTIVSPAKPNGFAHFARIAVNNMGDTRQSHLIHEIETASTSATDDGMSMCYV